MGIGITRVKQACQNLSLAATCFFGHEPPLAGIVTDHKRKIPSRVFIAFSNCR